MSHAALTMEAALRRAPDPHGHAAARQFVALAREIARHRPGPELLAAVEARGLGPLARELATKAAVPATTLADAWGDAAGREMARAYLASVRNRSLLDSIAPYATPLPVGIHRVLVAFDSVADHAGQGDPKPVMRPGLANRDTTPVKSVGLAIFSQELFDNVGEEARRLFEAELANAVTAAANDAVLAVATIGAIPLPSSGDAVADLRTALAAAPDSDHYVIAATRPVARELALASDGRLPIAGGTFSPGVDIVPVRGDTATPAMVVIPSSRCVLRDFGLSIRSASQASVAMRTDPTAPAEMTSLWQTNCIGLLAEREHRLYVDAPAVVVG